MKSSVRKVINPSFLVKTMSLKERIMELYLGDRELSLRYFGVAKKLRSDLEETQGALIELADGGVMFKRVGYYQLNHPVLWKDENIKTKYEKRVLESSK